jgi:hypothetical protein
MADLLGNLKLQSQIGRKEWPPFLLLENSHCSAVSEVFNVVS